MAKYKHELIRPITGQLGRVEVLKNVDAVHGDESLVHLEDTRPRLERDRLKTPAVSADCNHLLTGQILRPLLPKPRLAGDVALVILAHERQPASVEDHDVAFVDLHSLLCRDLVDLLAIEGCTLRHKF